jgi:hypothetical protein
MLPKCFFEGDIKMIKRIALLMMIVLGFSAVSIRAAGPSTTILDEVRQISADDQGIITTAHIVYIHEKTSEPPKKEIMNFIGEGLSRANQHIVTEEEFFLDNAAKQAKKVITDLRDINTLIAENNIPDTRLNRLNLEQSAVVLYENGSVFRFNPDTPSGSLDKFSGTFEPDFPTLGIIPLTLLNQDAQLDDIETDGRASLRISRSQEVSGGLVDTVIICEPSIGYRLRSIRWSMAGRVFKEIVADDYKDVNGIPYPFSYISRQFSREGRLTADTQTGTLRFEHKYTIKRAEFGTKLSEADFKIFITSRTPITDFSGASLSLPRSGLGKGTGINDILAIRDEAEELHKAQYQETQ